LADLGDLEMTSNRSMVMLTMTGQAKNVL